MQKRLYAEAIRDYNVYFAQIGSENIILNEYWSRSNALFEIGEYLKVLQDVESIIRLNPSYHPAFFRKAETYAKMGKYNESIVYYGDFIERFPSSEYSKSSLYDSSTATAYRGRGMIYQKQKLYKEAVADLQTAARLYNIAGSIDNEQFCLKLVQDILKIK